MNVFYLFNYNLDLPGVNAKIVDKILSLNQIGVKVNGIVLYNDKEINLNFLSDNIFEKQFFAQKVSENRMLKTRLLSPLNTLINNLKAVKDLYSQVLGDKKMDLIIMRYGISDYSSLWLVKKLQGRVIYESNTIELEQLKVKYKGIFKSPIWVSYDYFNEKYMAPIVLRRVKAIVCVTNEIAQYQSKRVGKKNGPVIKVISNGINVNAYPVAKALSCFLGNHNLIILLGVNSEWNGLDKIENAVINSDKNIKLFVVGNVKQSQISDKIIYKGLLTSNEISELIEKENICAGVGTLALERKGIKEAAPLKVREYLARGLPVVYNYEDTDIDKDLTFRDNYCIKLEYGAKTIDIDMVIGKLEKILTRPNYNEKIREFALKNIDVSSKAFQYKELIDKLNDSSN